MTDNPVAVLDELIEAARLHLDGLVALRSAMASEPEPEPAETELEDDDEFTDTWTASERFNVPIDTIRWLCRHKGMGRKKHGARLWEVNVKALRRYLERRSRLS
jgi:hypothetical protein